MECFRNIVAIANGNSARLIAKIDPVRLTGNEGIALVSIYHGGVYTITSENNMVYFSHPSVIDDESDRLSVQIPEGNYGTCYDICLEISNLIRVKLKRGRKDVFAPSINRNRETVDINIDGTRLFVNNTEKTPWSMLGVSEDQSDSF